jgi:hypothetical protein
MIFAVTSVSKQEHISVIVRRILNVCTLTNGILTSTMSKARYGRNVPQEYVAESIALCNTSAIVVPCCNTEHRMTELNSC